MNKVLQNNPLAGLSTTATAVGQGLSTTVGALTAAYASAGAQAEAALAAYEKEYCTPATFTPSECTQCWGVTRWRWAADTPPGSAGCHGACARWCAACRAARGTPHPPHRPPPPASPTRRREGPRHLHRQGPQSGLLPGRVHL